MSEVISKQLQTLTRRQQRRIWIKRLADRMPPLFWWCACVLAPAACIHQQFLPLNPIAVICVAIVPPVLMLLWLTVAERPTANEGAVAADRLFMANSLFVSAWELSRSATAIDGVAPLLLARTEAALPLWSQCPHRPLQHDMKPASLAALTLCLVGLFFVLLPSHVQTTEVSSYSAPSMPTEPIKQADNPPLALSELFASPEETTAEVAGHDIAQEYPPDSSKSGPLQIPSQNSQELTASTRESAPDRHEQADSRDEKTTAVAQTASPASARTEGTKMADRTPGNDMADNTGGVTSRARQFNRTRLIDIETGVDGQSTAFDNVHEGAALLASVPQKNADRQQAIRFSQHTSQTGSASLLSAEQRTLVRRYFKQLEETDDPND